MDSPDLAFCTTQDLVNELMRRETFLGVVVHAVDEFKNRQWNGERLFRMHFNANLDAEQAGRLLDVVAEHIEGKAL